MGACLQLEKPHDPRFSLNERLSNPKEAGVLGRFISRDPIGHSGGLNLYAYPTNPVNFTDPNGLNPEEQWYRAIERYLLEGFKEGKPTDFCSSSRLEDIGGQSTFPGSGHKGVGSAEELLDHLEKRNPPEIDRVRRSYKSVGGKLPRLGPMAILGLVLSMNNVANADEKLKALAEEAYGCTPPGQLEGMKDLSKFAGNELLKMSVTHEAELKQLFVNLTIEGGYLFNVDLRPSTVVPRHSDGPSFLFQK